MSNTSSDSEESAELYNFSLVQFVHKGRKRSIEDIDVVPSKWLKFDLRRGRCTTQYPPSDANAEDYKVLQDMVKLQANAPESYVSYSIAIKGRAKTYDEAVKKLKDLQHEEHVLSVNSGESASEMQKKLENSVKRQDFLREAANKQLFFQKKASAYQKRKVKGVGTVKFRKSVNARARKTKVDSALKELTNSADSILIKNQAVNLDKDSDDLLSDEESSIVESKDKKHEPSNKENNVSQSKEASVQPSSSSKLIDQSKPMGGLVHPSTSKSIDASGPMEVQVQPSSLRSVDESEPLHGQESEADQVVEQPTAGNASQDENGPLNGAVIADLELSVLTSDNIQYSTAFEYAVLQRLSQLQISVTNLLTEQKRTNAFLLDKRVTNVLNSKIDFKIKYNLQLPMDTMEQFDQFDENLKNNEYLRNDVGFELTMLVDKHDVLAKSYVQMLKKFLSKDLAMKFTAVRVSTDKSKIQFRGNELSKCMDAVVCGTRAEKNIPTDQKEMITALSNVLCNVKKWNAK